MFQTLALLALLTAPSADPLKADLLSEDEGKAVEAAKKLGAAKKPEVLLDVLALGTPPKVTGAILEALIESKTPRALDVLLRYADNRNADLRKKALSGLARSGDDRRISERLLEALGDHDGSVRALAATFVAKRHEKGAEQALLKLLERGDAAAAAPLGTLATPEMTHKLAELYGTMPDAMLATALGEILKRGDVADPLRLQVVKTLAKMPGADATTALVEYVASVPAKQERPSKTEAQHVIDGRGGGK